MKIAIDAAGPLSSHEKGGISYFLEDFLAALSDIDKTNSYMVFGYFWRNYKKKKESISLPELFELKTLCLPGKIIRTVEQKFNMPVIESFLARRKTDIFHSISAQEMPCLKKIKSVYNIYDLAFEINPSWYKDKYYTYIYKSAVRADVILATSFATKKDIIEIYKIPESKIQVVWLGVNRNIFFPLPQEKHDSLRAKYGLPEEFILSVATSVGRKNIPMLLNVFGNLLKKGRKEKFLVVAGSPQVKAEIKEIINKKSLQNHVLCCSEISKTALSHFYNLAKCFAFPSLYEGFGLPVLEAMACGCPVIASNVSSLPEIGGKAAVFADPNSEDEISGAIEKVLDDGGLRNDMIKKGLEQAGLFSWEKTALETLKIYEKVLSAEDNR